jgi:hypothetical protein
MRDLASLYSLFTRIYKMAKKLSDTEKKASQTVLGDLRKHMQGMLSDKMKGMKKVTVASDTKEGLKKGMETAEKILKSKDDVSTDLLEPKDEIAKQTEEELPEGDSEFLEDSSEEASECDDMSEEELDAKIKELMAAKAKLSK